MKMFFLKFILLVALMFVAVLFGMQQAHGGIERLKGYDDVKFEEAVTIQESETGDLAVSLLGNEIRSHDLLKKKEELERMKAYNFFSSIGKSLAEAVSTMTEKTIHFITDFIQNKAQSS